MAENIYNDEEINEVVNAATEWFCFVLKRMTLISSIPEPTKLYYADPYSKIPFSYWQFYHHPYSLPNVLTNYILLLNVLQSTFKCFSLYPFRRPRLSLHTTSVCLSRDVSDLIWIYSHAVADACKTLYHTKSKDSKMTENDISSLNWWTPLQVRWISTYCDVKKLTWNNSQALRKERSWLI